MEQSKPIYEPLENVATSLRLIEVHPPSPDYIVRVRMRQVQAPTEYCCLSYMWGDASREHTILVNDQPVQIRRNLYAFLRTAQRRYTSISLWIDALCINQEDNIERSQQVQHMGDIYHDAEKVYIWLGTEPSLNYAFEFSKVCRYPMEEDLTLSMLLGRRRNDFAEERENFLASRFEILCHHAYWHRTWIAQEILLARQIVVINRANEMSWDSMITTMKFIAKRTLRPRAWAFLNTSLIPTFDSHRAFQASNRTNIREGRSIKVFLSWLGDSLCMDPRDRIYSQLSLVPEGNLFTVNYDEGVYSLFWRAGEFFESWSDVTYTYTLFRALGLTIQGMTDYLIAETPFRPIEVTLTIEYIYLTHTEPIPIPETNEKSDSRIPFMRKKSKTQYLQTELECPRCDCDFICSTSTNDDILICLAGVPHHTHVRLWPMDEMSYVEFYVPDDSYGFVPLCRGEAGIELASLLGHGDRSRFLRETGGKAQFPAALILAYLQRVETGGGRAEVG